MILPIQVVSILNKVKTYSSVAIQISLEWIIVEPFSNL